MNGIYLLKPTSIVSSGSGNSSSIGANGSVTFSSCDSLSVNGIFSSDFTNYKLMIRHNGTAASTIRIRLRVQDADATASDYRHQTTNSYGTTTDGNRYSYGLIELSSVSANERAGTVCYIFGPYIADTTTFRSFDTGPWSGAFPSYLMNVSGNHSLQTSYDSFTLSVGSGLMTGLVSVYGLVK